MRYGTICQLNFWFCETSYLKFQGQLNMSLFYYFELKAIKTQKIQEKLFTYPQLTKFTLERVPVPARQLLLDIPFYLRNLSALQDKLCFPNISHLSVKRLLPFVFQDPYPFPQLSMSYKLQLPSCLWGLLFLWGPHMSKIKFFSSQFVLCQFNYQTKSKNIEGKEEECFCPYIVKSVF